jgi:anti-sigma B factor antagonist
MAELGHGDARLTFDLAEDQDGAPLVRLGGELDMTTAPGLESALRPILAGGPERIVIDASALQFADSSAIALLVRLSNLVPQVEVRHPPELLRRVIARMGLSSQLRISP